MEESLLSALLDKGLVFAIMGAIIWWLVRRYEKAESDKSELAKDVIKLTVAYETKLDADKAKDAEIKLLLTEIRDELREWKR